MTLIDRVVSWFAESGQWISALDVVVPDLLGTGVFAFAGAVLARDSRFNVLGVAFVALVSATGGGTVRQLVLGSPDIFWLADFRYFLVTGVAVLLAYLPFRNRVVRNTVFQYFDTFGLGVFVALGFTQYYGAGSWVLIACALGALTGCGGGLMRDVLTGRPPQALIDKAYPFMVLGACVGCLAAIKVGQPAWIGAVLVVLCFELLRQGLRMAGVLRRPGSFDTRHASTTIGFNASQSVEADDAADESWEGTGSTVGAMATAPRRRRRSWFDNDACLAMMVFMLIGAVTMVVLRVDNLSLRDLATLSTQSLAERKQFLADRDGNQVWLLEQAQDALATGRASEAAGYYNHVLEINPVHADATAGLASAAALWANDIETLMEGGDLEAAQQQIDHLQRTLGPSELLEKLRQQWVAAEQALATATQADAITPQVTASQSAAATAVKKSSVKPQQALSTSDRQYALQQFNLLALAVRNRNEKALSQLTQENPERLKLFARLFETYLEINARVEPVENAQSPDTAVAVLTLESMLLPNGNRAFPSPEYDRITLKIVRPATAGASQSALSRIQW